MWLRPFAVLFADDTLRYGLEVGVDGDDAVCCPRLFDSVAQAQQWAKEDIVTVLNLARCPEVTREGEPVLVSAGVYAVDATATREQLTSCFTRDDRMFALVALPEDEIVTRRDPQWATRLEEKS